VLVLGEGSNLLFATDFTDWCCDRHGAPCASARTMAVRRSCGPRPATVGRARRLDTGTWPAGAREPGTDPGLVGAAPIQNIGAYGVEASEFITSVDAWDRARGGFVRLDAADCGFGYRDSVFKREPDRWIVSNVEFRFDRARRPVLDYAGVREELAPWATPTRPRRRSRQRCVACAAANFLTRPASASGQLLQESRAGERACRRIEGGQSIAARVCRWRGLEQALRGVAHRGLRWRGLREGDAGIPRSTRWCWSTTGAPPAPNCSSWRDASPHPVDERFGVRLEPEPRIVGAEF